MIKKYLLGLSIMLFVTTAVSAQEQSKSGFAAAKAKEKASKRSERNRKFGQLNVVKALNHVEKVKSARDMGVRMTLADVVLPIAVQFISAKPLAVDYNNPPLGPGSSVIPQTPFKQYPIQGTSPIKQ